MNTKKQKKAGFTLVELMVVAIIVAILAAVAIPLMSGNRERAMATEAQAGCSTVATGIKLAFVQNGNATTNLTAAVGLPGIQAGDLNGTYFNDSSYVISDTTGPSDYTITATGKDEAADETVIMTVTSGDVAWTGTLLD